MADFEVLDTLAKLPHFRSLRPDLLERIAAGSHRIRLRGGEVVFREGEPCEGFFAVRRGVVQLSRTDPDGKPRVIHHLGAGRTFAEAALLTMKVYPATATALTTPTELIRIRGESFLQLFRGNTDLAAAMVSSLSVWLAQLVERVEELSLVTSSARLARYLLRLPASGPAGRLAVQLPLPKKDLAAHLATTPENLSRLLRRWHDAGWIESQRRAVVLLDTTRLLAIADGDERAAAD
ncbi:MAG: Crp/Fnr family transcriptional regulator [Planctomycetota bacterium]